MIEPTDSGLKPTGQWDSGEVHRCHLRHHQ